MVVALSWSTAEWKANYVPSPDKQFSCPMITKRWDGICHDQSLYKTKELPYDTCMWTAEEVRALRSTLEMSQSEFARLIGVDQRTVARWESGNSNSRPSGASEQILSALNQKLIVDASRAEAHALKKFLTGTVAVGGLAYLLMKLLDFAMDRDS